MIKNVTSVALPVDEVLNIKKRRIVPEYLNSFKGKAREKETKSIKRIAVVTGTHGDELEGQYVCFELARRISEIWIVLKV